MRTQQLGATSRGVDNGFAVISQNIRLIAWSAFVFLFFQHAATAQLPVPLGTASNFAVLAGSGITIAGAIETTTITGDIGTFPTLSISGLENVILNGVNQAGNAVTQTAKDDLVTAYNNAAGRVVDFTIGTELGGANLIPGVYDSADGTFEITGTLLLDGQGNPDAVFIFQMESTLITAANSAIVLTNGARACNVFWQVGSSATLGTGSDFSGTIMALDSITLVTGTTVDGHLLARNAAATLDSNTLTLPCREIPLIPGYTLEKTRTSPLGRPAAIGEAITFTITVVNTGNVPLVTVPLEDTYETAYLLYVDSDPSSNDNVNDGVINWANIGPISTGSSVSVDVAFVGVFITEGMKTNTVVASPTTAPGEPPVPPQTSDAPYEIAAEIVIQRLLELDKIFNSVTVPDANGNFVVNYTLTVTNAGESAEFYTLIDTTLFDPNFIVLSNNVTGHVITNIAGTGPYLIVTNEVIAVGATHEYFVQIYARLNASVRNGDAEITLCGEPGEGLFNQATLQYNVQTELIDDACGELILAGTLCIGDTVWVDADSDSQPDENLDLMGINDVRVELFHVIDGATNFVGFQMTSTLAGQQGYYLFTNLPPFGVYIAQVILSTVPPIYPVLTTPQRYVMDTASDFPQGCFITADFGFNNAYGTPIELKSFTAEPFDGGVRLAWETEWEVQTLGYNVYRASLSSASDRLKINSALIPGLGSENGHAYEMVDGDVTPGADYFYWLEEVAVNGIKEIYGPVAIHMGEVQSGASLARVSMKAGGGVLVRMRYESLVAAGIPLSQLEANRLQVLVDGNEVARFVSTDSKQLSTGDFILFYSPPSDRERVVSIAYSDSGDAMTMAWVYARPRAGGGEVGLAIADAFGRATFNASPGQVRLLISGFTSPVIWALDITDPVAPAILYGYSTVAADVAGLYAVYLTIIADEVVQGIAVQDERVVDLE